jgi:hypothetical protein
MTRSKTRLNPLQGIQKDDSDDDNKLLRSIQTKAKQSAKSKKTESKKTETKKTTQKPVKKKPPVVTPIYKMVKPYTPQQFFDQKVNITNGQLLAMNPKFGLTIAKQLRKPVVRKKGEEQEKKPAKEPTNNEALENEVIPKVKDLMQVANTAGPNDD